MSSDNAPIKSLTSASVYRQTLQTRIGTRLTALLMIVVLTGIGLSAVACPFCISEKQTLTEEIATSSVVLLVRLEEPSPVAEAVEDSGVPYGFVDPSTGSAKFAIQQVLQGEELMEGVSLIEALYFGTPDKTTTYFVRGLGEPPEWNIPLPLSPIAAEYVPKLFGLSESGGDRLAFFQTYLQHDDTLLSQDAYDEFARAPYAELVELGDRMNREQLLTWIQSSSVSPSRRRLFLTMLGVCGTEQDAKQIESMIASDIQVLNPSIEAGVAASLATNGLWGCAFTPDILRINERQRKLGLDAMIACYLTLSGKQGEASAGLDLIDARFLTNPEADYTHIYSSLMALRFLGEEQSALVPRDRVLQSARLLLDSKDFSEQIIPDLARWEDWSVLDQLTGMFKSSLDPGENKYVREPIITYLDIAAEQEGEIGERAIAALAEIEPLDSDAVRRARSLAAFGMLAQARAKNTAKKTVKPVESPPAETASEEVTAEATIAEETDAQTAKASEPGDTTTTDNSIDSDTVLDSPNLMPLGISTENSPEGTEELGTNSALESVAAGKETSQSFPIWVLLIFPVIAAVLCFGVFWWILKGGTR